MREHQQLIHHNMEKLEIYCNICEISLGQIVAEKIKPEHYESMGCGTCGSLVPYIGTPIEIIEE